MAYSEQEILEKIVDFKAEHGRFPTKEDFDSKNGLPSRRTLYRYLGSIANACRKAELLEKGELEIEARPIGSEEQKGFRCRFCGHYTSNVEEYYSGLTIILTMRFTELLKSKTKPCCVESVMDCIHGVFGPKKIMVREALEDLGFLKKFDERFNVHTDEFAANCIEKQRCHVCGKLKNSWDMTVDKFGKWWEFICEDCLAKKQQSRKKKPAKVEGPVNVITDRKETPITWDDLLED